jgi:transcriptional/translational regulatory protein YebC/TACO1
MFNKKGYITVSKENADEEALMEIALEAGAEDVREENEVFEIITGTNDFESVKSGLEKASIPSLEAEITMLPQNTTNLEGKDAEKMIKLMETLEDCDDVQKVYTNADIPEDMAG